MKKLTEKLCNILPFISAMPTESMLFHHFAAATRAKLHKLVYYSVALRLRELFSSSFRHARIRNA